MAQLTKTELTIDHRFNAQTCRHTLNGSVAVLHCHHFTSLYSQLADDCSLLDAKKLMAEVSEDTFWEILQDYYNRNNICSLNERIAIAEQYYSYIGLGRLKVGCAGSDGGEVELTRSHVDEGWIKKWGQRSQAVNFLTCGYIAALFAAALNRSPRAFRALETQSIVSGASSSKFQVIAN